MSLDLIPLPENSPIVLAGKAANHAAARASFDDYRSRRPHNTIRRQDADLTLFADFLKDAGAPVGDLATDPQQWQGITWGLVEGFVKWQLMNGYAVGTVNLRLSTVKTYAQLALKAGALDVSEYARIRTVKGYSQSDKLTVDQTRRSNGIETRRSTKARATSKASKKTEPVFLSKEQRDALIEQPDTPKGIRDALMVCLMLEQGLRVGEVVILQRADFDLSSGLLRVYRPKTQKTQVHRLTEKTLAAARSYLKIAPKDGNIWRRGAEKGNADLTEQGMSERAINYRLAMFGRHMGIDNLSAHDLRHTWAERAKKNPAKTLQEAGGWNSPAMPLRYQKSSEIANDGLLLED